MNLGSAYIFSVTEADCQALVLDAGHIAIESKLVDKDQVKEVQSKRGKQYSNDDYRQLEDLMYDRLSLRLESTQVRMLLFLSQRIS
jgi:vacuolar protein sorting-associated protein 13A/C